jgi:hypothetical protein
MKKQKLIPMKVPWMVSPSTPFLRLFASEQSSQESTYVEFVAYYKCEETHSSDALTSGVNVVKQPASFQKGNTGERGPYRLIRIVFENGLWARLSPAHSDKEVVEDCLFDWSAVRGRWSQGEDIYEFMNRTREEWVRSGICPDPNIYEVEGSHWLDETRAANDRHKKWRHYVIQGHDAYAEIIAEGCTILEGQVLSAW